MKKAYAKVSDEKDSISGRVLKQLRQDIITGKYASGSRLLEIELSQTYEVSRGTIRSILQELSAEGLVEFLETGGCVAVGFTEKTVRDTYQFRNLLELQAAQILLSDHPFSYVEMMKVLDLAADKENQPLYRENPVEFYLDLDIRFHQAMVYAAGNRPIYRAWCAMSALIRTLMLMNLSEEYWSVFEQRFYTNHKKLLDLAILKDPQLLEEMERQYYNATEIAVNQLMLTQEKNA